MRLAGSRDTQSTLENEKVFGAAFCVAFLIALVLLGFFLFAERSGGEAPQLLIYAIFGFSGFAFLTYLFHREMRRLLEGSVMPDNSGDVRYISRTTRREVREIIKRNKAAFPITLTRRELHAAYYRHEGRRAHALKQAEKLAEIEMLAGFRDKLIASQTD